MTELTHKERWLLASEVSQQYLEGEIRCDSRKVGRWECQERHKENKLDVLTSCGEKVENDVNGS